MNESRDLNLSGVNPSGGVNRLPAKTSRRALQGPFRCVLYAEPSAVVLLDVSRRIGRKLNDFGIRGALVSC